MVWPRPPPRLPALHPHRLPWELPWHCCLRGASPLQTQVISRLSTSWVVIQQHVPPPRLSLAVATGSPRAQTPVPTSPIPSGLDPAESASAPLLRLPILSRSPSAPTVVFDGLGAAAELHVGDSAARHSQAVWEREQQAEPTCWAAIKHSIIGGSLASPAEALARIPSYPRPSVSEIQGLAAS